MKRIISFSFLLLIAMQVNAQKTSSLIDELVNKYCGKWPKSISFTQKTVLINDSTKIYQTWYEAGIFPDRFRIDFDRAAGSSAIFSGDKQYRFTNGKLTRTSPNNNFLIYLVGGMYFHPLDSVKKTISNIGIDINEENMTTWKGKKVRVLGAKEGDLTKNQIWYDEKDLYLVRFIHNLNPKVQMDYHFYGHIKIGNAWHEMLIDFYQNGKLTQTEEYQDYNTNVTLDPAIFDPAQYGKVYWK